ncbi:hypothetical protein LTR56_024771 [Elasticomyces elasticus]|nr:hypothetical protein LTR56_024771 [Elasticomyces elasticus]KAK3622061.1 hypothetical protein LTR22_024950 [Elasticomyces elasticus]KAK4905251.1 hypothetical protein LTR49_025441 [Elasticomyces elasticus]KAK5747658.1 hypothetical protein LTS12_022314 [Elasticomyces elasticus]
MRSLSRRPPDSPTGTEKLANRPDEILVTTASGQPTNVTNIYNNIDGRGTLGRAAEKVTKTASPADMEKSDEEKAANAPAGVPSRSPRPAPRSSRTSFRVLSPLPPASPPPPASPTSSTTTVVAR